MCINQYLVQVMQQTTLYNTGISQVWLTGINLIFLISISTAVSI